MSEIVSFPTAPTDVALPVTEAPSPSPAADVPSASLQQAVAVLLQRGGVSLKDDAFAFALRRDAAGLSDLYVTWNHRALSVELRHADGYVSGAYTLDARLVPTAWIASGTASGVARVVRYRVASPSYSVERKRRHIPIKNSPLCSCAPVGRKSASRQKRRNHRSGYSIALDSGSSWLL